MKKILFLIVALSATLNMSANAPAVSVGAAKPVVLVDVPTARDLYEKLGDAVLEVGNFAKTLEEGQTKTDLEAAVATAKTLYMAGYDEAKGNDYENAYNTLMYAYQTALSSVITDKLGVLDIAITDAGTAMAALAYSNDYKKPLQDAINKATGVKTGLTTGHTGDYKLSDIETVEKAITVLNGEVERITGLDYTKASEALATSISIATTRMGEIRESSIVIADALDTAIGTAVDVQGATDPASTAKQLKSASETLDKAVTTQNTALTAFLNAKVALNKYITETAMPALAGIKEHHEAICNVLSNAISTAQGVYFDAITKKTTDLTGAQKTLTTAVGTANTSEGVAISIDTWVKNAEAVLSDLIGTEDWNTVNNAINAAKSAVKEKSAKNDLNNALTALQNATQSFIDTAKTTACTNLENKIQNAANKIDAVLAYDNYIQELTTAKDVADAIYQDPANYTVTEIKAAAENLETATNAIVEKDADLAEQELLDAIDAADAKVIEVDAINTTLAGDLKDQLVVANNALQNGTARVRKSNVETLTQVIEDVDDAVELYNSNVSAIAQEIEAAGQLPIKDTHTGIQEALNDAIGVAEDVQRDIMNKTNAEIEGATHALQGAVTEAKNAEKNAGKLDEMIAEAKTALDAILDEDVKDDFDAAIEDAESLFGDKTKTSNDYMIAFYTLQTLKNRYVNDDIAVAKGNLDAAMDYALEAKDSLVNEDFIKEIEKAYKDAETVYKKTDAKAQEIVDAETALRTSVRQIVDGDLVMTKASLIIAIEDAVGVKDEYDEIGDAINDDDIKVSYKTAVIADIASAISNAINARDSEKPESKVMDEKEKALGTAKTTMIEAYGNMWKTQKTEFISQLFAEEGLANQIKLQNNVIVNDVSTAAFKAGQTLGKSIIEKNIAEIINSRKAMETEYQALNTEFNTWTTKCGHLNDTIVIAGNVLANLQEEHKGTAIEDDLEKAIANANIAKTNVADKFSYDVKAAIKALNDTIEMTVYADTHWDFTDASEFKAGKYAVGNAKYTRSVSGDYGTFCMPMDIKVTYAEGAPFSNVYVPENFAILSDQLVDGENHKILKLFLTKKNEGDVITVGTPFFAQLACEDVDLMNDKELYVKADGPYALADTNKKINPASKNITVYTQEGESSFVTKDASIKCSWSGTFQMTEDCKDKQIFLADGTFGPAEGYISPFRAFIKLTGLTSSAKSVDAIEVDFGDGSETTGIRSILMGSSDGSQIFSIDGKNMGNDMNSLNKGVYIINGKKVLK